MEQSPKLQYPKKQENGALFVSHFWNKKYLGNKKIFSII